MLLYKLLFIQFQLSTLNTRGAGFGEYKIILQNPQPSEENLIFKVTNFNKVTNRC